MNIYVWYGGLDLRLFCHDCRREADEDEQLAWEVVPALRVDGGWLCHDCRARRGLDGPGGQER